MASWLGTAHYRDSLNPMRKQGLGFWFLVVIYTGLTAAI